MGIFRLNIHDLFNAFDIRLIQVKAESLMCQSCQGYVNILNLSFNLGIPPCERVKTVTTRNDQNRKP